MPITVDGVEVTEQPATCDRPSALTGTCETGQHISAKYVGTHHDGSPRPEVTFINFCRDGGQGLIGHNSQTGATCFFHMNQHFPNTVEHPGSNDPNYDDYWQTAEEVAADNCQSCHQADPWLHSPWIDQLRDLEDPSKTLVPVTLDKSTPYIIVGEDFEQPIHEGAPENSCTSCHRPQCDTNFSVPLGQLVMPGPFEASNFHAELSEGVQEMRDWCESLPNMSGGLDEDSICEDFVSCYMTCETIDCMQTCATEHLEGELQGITQTLITCIESSTCDNDVHNEDCFYEACPSELIAFYEACGY